MVHPTDASKHEPGLELLDMCMASFDGGAAQKLGVGGVCIADRSGKLVLC